MPHKAPHVAGDGGRRSKPAVFSSVAQGRPALLQKMCPVSIWVPTALIRFSELFGGSIGKKKCGRGYPGKVRGRERGVVVNII